MTFNSSKNKQNNKIPSPSVRKNQRKFQMGSSDLRLKKKNWKGVSPGLEDHSPFKGLKYLEKLKLGISGK